MLDKLRESLPKELKHRVEKLTESDLFETEDGAVIIKRSGILKIESTIESFRLEQSIHEIIPSQKGESVFMRNEYQYKGAEGLSPTKITFSSATPSNCTNDFKIETCEKRGRSRAVLEASGLAAYGLRGEDEDKIITPALGEEKKGQKSFDDALRAVKEANE